MMGICNELIIVLQIAFAGIFTIARMIGGPYLTYVTLSAHNPLLIKVSSPPSTKDYSIYFGAQSLYQYLIKI